MQEAFPKDLFLQRLQFLKSEFEEYADILEFVIETVEQDQHEKFQNIIRIMQEDDEWQ